MSAPAKCDDNILLVQWLYRIDNNADGATSYTLDSNCKKCRVLNPKLTERFPYTVPNGYKLYLTDMTIASKLVADGGAAIFGINDVASVTSINGHVTFKTPIVLDSGTKLTAHMTNNSLEAQILQATAQGYLLPE